MRASSDGVCYIFPRISFLAETPRDYYQLFSLLAGGGGKIAIGEMRETSLLRRADLFILCNFLFCVVRVHVVDFSSARNTHVDDDEDDDAIPWPFSRVWPLVEVFRNHYQLHI